MNFIEEYKKGQSGGNKGLYMGDGLQHVSSTLNGLQQGRLYGIASSPKVGKSTIVNYGFVVQPYLYALKHNISIEWIYYSLEMDRISQEFDFAAHFLYADYGVRYIEIEGLTKDGKNIIEISSKYLRGRLQDDKGKIIKVSKKVEDALKKVYQNRIIPLFGEYSVEGELLKKGMITFIQNSDNPTGIFKYLLNHASHNGTLIKTGQKGFERITSYKPNNPKKFTIVITDHLRKLIPERGWLMKQTVDKTLEYHVILRNLLNYTFVDIIHLNRSMTNLERFKQFGDLLFPDSDMVKDSGNIAEDCDYLFTLFNPNDERYNLNKHFNLEIKDSAKNILYPELRTIHLVESRHCEFPQHFRVNMQGAIKNFELFNN